jgi:prepilin-type N-terminal cleavage/methylation domain-containing protein
MKTKAFTLLEILGVLAILGILAAVSATGIRSLMTNGAAQSDVIVCHNIATDIGALFSQPTFDGFIPITGTVGSVPVTGANLTAVSAALIQSAACFENVLIANGVLSTPYKFGFGPSRGFETVPLLYNPAQHSFYTPGDVAPVPGPMAQAPRVLTVIATPGVTPSTARGANFWLTPNQDLPAGAIVFFAYHPQLDARQAYALAVKLNAPGATLPAAGQQLDNGPVVYASAGAATNKTDVFVFLSSK